MKDSKLQDEDNTIRIVSSFLALLFPRQTPGTLLTDCAIIGICLDMMQPTGHLIHMRLVHLKTRTKEGFGVLCFHPPILC